MVPVGIRAALSATAVLVAAVAASVFSPHATAGAVDRPGTWSSVAEASGLRVSVVRPAALPTNDEVGGLSIPFARAQTDSSPSGRAIGSWLWPGEGLADAKSLLLVGLDPSTAEAEIEERKRRHPGTNGCEPERVLATPEVSHPATGETLVVSKPIVNPLTNSTIPDPTDNPCGEYQARAALQRVVKERVPDYPFWARSVWPAVQPEDAAERRTLCEALGAFPEQWQLPPQVREPCPPGREARGGVTEARSDHRGSWASARLARFEVPGFVRAEEVTALSSVEWRGRVLAASSTASFENLEILGPAGSEFVTAEFLRSTVIAFSDGRPAELGIEASGLTVVLSGSRYRAAIGRDGVRITDTSLPEDLRDQILAALDRAAIRFGEVSAGDLSLSGAAGGPQARAGTPASVTAFSIELVLGGRDALQGRTTVRLSFGTATAAALTRWSPPARIGSGNGGSSIDSRKVFVPGVPGLSPTTVGEGPGEVRGTAKPSLVGRGSLMGLSTSEPIPPALVVLAIVGAAVVAGLMVLAGIRETLY